MGGRPSGRPPSAFRCTACPNHSGLKSVAALLPRPARRDLVAVTERRAGQRRRMLTPGTSERSMNVAAGGRQGLETFRVDGITGVFVVPVRAVLDPAEGGVDLGE